MIIEDQEWNRAIKVTVKKTSLRIYDNRLISGCQFDL